MPENQWANSHYLFWIMGQKCIFGMLLLSGYVALKSDKYSLIINFRCPHNPSDTMGLTTMCSISKNRRKHFQEGSPSHTQFPIRKGNIRQKTNVCDADRCIFESGEFNDRNNTGPGLSVSEYSWSKCTRRSLSSLSDVYYN